jgi:hypothetical protein
MDVAHGPETLSLRQSRWQRDIKADAQAFARQHYGWRGSDDGSTEHVDTYTGGFTSSQSTLGRYHGSSDGVSPSPNDSQLKPEATPELVSQHLGNNRKRMSIKAPEKVVGRHDRKCQNTAFVTSLEANGEGESIAARVVTRNNRSLRERRFHNARTNTPPSTVVSPQMNARVVTERESIADTVSATNTEHDESIFNAEPVDKIQSVGTLIQHLLYSDNITFDAAIHALRVDLEEDSTKWYHFVAVSSCFAVVPITWLVVKEMIRWVSK